jgi:polysaccharide biosynthesis protein PslG
LRQKFLFTFALLLPVVVSSFGCVRNNYALANDCRFTAPSGSISATIPEGLGVNIHFIDPQPGEMKMIADAGFRWVRMDFKWDATERERGRYDFSAYDRLMAALQDYNIHALFILDYGNPLYDNGAPPRTPAAREAFARWAVAAAKRFSGRGVVWELYNEPNHQIFWPPRPNVSEYVELALVVGEAFRTSVPSERLIGPAISEFDFPFLEACFRAGLLDYWTAVSVHPYLRSDPEMVASEYCRLRQMIARVRTPTSRGSERVIPIISSEWGYSSVWRGMSEEKQGAIFARQAMTNLANGIPISIWYDWRDDGVDPNDAEHHFGLVRQAYHQGRDQVYDPKPAYLAAKTLSEVFKGYHFERRLPVGDENDYVLFFVRSNDVRLAVWTTSANAHRIIIPLDPGEFTVTGHTGQRHGRVSAGQEGLSIDVSTAPIYLTRVK